MHFESIVSNKTRRELFASRTGKRWGHLLKGVHLTIFHCLLLRDLCNSQLVGNFRSSEVHGGYLSKTYGAFDSRIIEFLTRILLFVQQYVSPGTGKRFQVFEHAYML